MLFQCFGILKIAQDEILGKCTLLAAVLLFHSCFFTHNINQRWANLCNGRAVA